MAHTFIILPTGDIEVDHIREMFYDLKDKEFKYSQWFPRAALIDKKANTTHLFTGQKYSEANFDFDMAGWTHDHCDICFITISQEQTDFVQNEGYFDGSDWVCKSCYEIIVSAKDIEEKLKTLTMYIK